MSGLPLEISCERVFQELSSGQEFLLLDCREQHEYELVSIQGASLLPISQLPERSCELSGKENQAIYVYCHHGVRSAQVATWLREQGFSQAYSMIGGIDAWALEIEPGMKRY